MEYLIHTNPRKSCLNLIECLHAYGSIEVGVEGRKVISGLLASLVLTRKKDSMAAEARKANVEQPCFEDSNRKAKKRTIKTLERNWNSELSCNSELEQSANVAKTSEENRRPASSWLLADVNLHCTEIPELESRRPCLVSEKSMSKKPLSIDTVVSTWLGRLMSSALCAWFRDVQRLQRLLCLLK